MVYGICGVDEAGRGPVIGPLVVAGVLVEDESRLLAIGVRDSKKCTPQRRERLAIEIKKVTECAITVLKAEEIDSLRERATINEIEAEIFAQVIERLKPEKAIVDAADTDENWFRETIKHRIGAGIEVIAEHGADAHYPVVSAASIIAKVERDRQIRRIREEIGVDIGSGYPSDPTTIKFLRGWVEEHGSLPPHTRKSWKTVKRLLREMQARTLDDFGGE